MNTLSGSASTQQRRGHLVGAHRAISLYPVEDSELCILNGRAWVTLNLPQVPGGLGDIVLQTGESLQVPAGSHVVMEPWVNGDALRFDWCLSAQAVEKSQRFAREVATPTRELGRALGQVVVAFARLLRGVLGYGEFLVAGRGRVLSRFESNQP
ncbi:MAG: DUF2917 domain-containing protein [Hydrogenophaga sp.]|uniref:DUF2917 domain-containing protein n=1 Tax=Hydrogenophaga sp. TaxID=1904254 RepID=UPI001DDD51F6|nr:DUF2917 domain-containing protein [Hydrogenophaga sp.]MBX3611124.1 DUF2917 domain-containing protein [Hydrogenophaga sp.]